MQVNIIGIDIGSIYRPQAPNRTAGACIEGSYGGGTEIYAYSLGSKAYCPVASFQKYLPAGMDLHIGIAFGCAISVI